jgi:hypothetical protein
LIEISPRESPKLVISPTKISPGESPRVIITNLPDKKIPRRISHVELEEAAEIVKHIEDYRTKAASANPDLFPLVPTAQ